MIVIRKDRPGTVGEPVLMRGDSSSAVQWVKKCKGGKGEVRSGGVMRILGVMEQIMGWCFRAKHVRGVENGLADGITRWKEDEIQSRLIKECRGRPRRLDRKERGGVRRFFTRLRTWAGCEVD